MLGLEILLIFVLFLKSDFYLKTNSEVKVNKYVKETYEIQTEDGYILTIHRIPPQEFTSKKPAVLLVHGILANSAMYLFNSKNSLGYILAKQGYDVWLLNTRGTSWSEKHQSLDPVKNRKEFYNFSWHEIGYYDLPASIDYILNFRNDSSLYYIGYSQGTTSFLVMASTRVEYNEKIRSAALIAPAAFFKYTKLFIANFVYEIEWFAKLCGIYDFKLAGLIRKFLTIYCRDYHEMICSNIIEFIGGNPNQTKLDEIFSNFPERVSLKQLYHYGQVTLTDFAQYDYKGLRNLEIYGSLKPPGYQLEKITTPVALYYGNNDRLVNTLDVRDLRKFLPNVIGDFCYSGYNHIDFAVAADADKRVYSKLIEIFDKC